MKISVKILLLALITFAYGCKKEGCRDPGALNFDSSADKDGTCRYTQVIFYAATNRVGGTADRVERIEIFEKIIQEETLIGTIPCSEEGNPSPVGCEAPLNSVVYEFTIGGQSTRFTTRYYYEGGANEAGDTYEFPADSEKDCYVQNLTLN